MRFLSDSEEATWNRMRWIITSNHRRNTERDRYAEGEELLRWSGYKLPNGWEAEQTPLHWPAKAIEVFASRAKPKGYSIEGHDDVVRELELAWTDSTGEFAEHLAIEAALRHGCSFVFVSAGNTAAGEPRVVVSPRSALGATCLMDPRTRRVTAALELVDGGREVLYLPDVALTLERTSAGRVVVVEESPTFGVPCAPYVHGATLSRPFGSSRITHSVMGFTRAGMRTFVRQEVSADWYMHPRERLLGVDADTFEDGAWTQSPGDIQALPDVHPDDDPNVPDSLRRAEWHAMPQMTMQPFSDQFRLIAAQFSGASSIPLQYLGIVSDSNPTSASAIEAQDIDLVRAIRNQHESLNLGRRMLALHVLNVSRGERVDPAEVASLRPHWEDPRVRSAVEQSQFVAQQIGSGNFRAGTRETLNLLPITDDEARIHAWRNRQAGNADLLERIAAMANPSASAEPAEPAGPGVK